MQQFSFWDALNKMQCSIRGKFQTRFTSLPFDNYYKIPIAFICVHEIPMFGIERYFKYLTNCQPFFFGTEGLYISRGAFGCDLRIKK